MTTPPVKFDERRTCDLVVDQVYEGGSLGNVKDDPLAQLLPVGNQGGFRYAGSPSRDDVRLIVLYTSGAEPDWPDELDVHTGRFSYYGDNRSPGRGLHDTQRRGNLLLRRIFDRANEGPERRRGVPPILLFDKPGRGRDVRFRGLLVPGHPSLSTEEELVAVWRSTAGARFQNYLAHFTVLDVPVVIRTWIDEALQGRFTDEACPATWERWVTSRSVRPLTAPPTIVVRRKAEQLPVPGTDDMNLLKTLHGFFCEDPFAFEAFAADVWQRSDPHVDRVDVTRPWRDGGRDAVGDYLIGPKADPVAVEFAVEAKCFDPGKVAVGVEATSRLISRLRHRQFGVLVTTSYVHRQAYSEIRADGHPVVIIAGIDLVRMLKRQGLDSPEVLARHLGANYAVATAASGAVDQ